MKLYLETGGKGRPLGHFSSQQLLLVGRKWSKPFHVKVAALLFLWDPYMAHRSPHTIRPIPAVLSIVARQVREPDGWFGRMDGGKRRKKRSFETGLFVASSPSLPCFFFLFSMSGNTVDEKNRWSPPEICWDPMFNGISYQLCELVNQFCCTINGWVFPNLTCFLLCI